MLQKKIRDELTLAMKAKDTLRVSVLRSLITAFTNDLVAKKRKPSDELDDDNALAVIKRAANQRKDSIEQFIKGNRPELAQKEKDELAIIETYLPPKLSKEEIARIIQQKKEELGISDKSGMGKLIGAVMQELKGKADSSDVKEAVEHALS